MIGVSKELWEENGVEVVVDKYSIKWSNEKHIEEGLDHANLPIVTRRYSLEYRKHRYELVDEPKQQPNRMFLDEHLAIKIIQDCKTDSCKFRKLLRIKSRDGINNKQQTITRSKKMHLKVKICKVNTVS